ncbi:hypothetical protein POPTR_019G133550v4 [Populus trichocarpa]|uniref:Uncharacterized protein n=1 Tax=Populus trichocarpa TaxID=3694 RepID=A0ACC0RKS5_POPTR|nr:hypothetical protein BDE02_19G117000 [Populus trichocarpa]KAI9377878.1 hypothetical protein POPTR_019G133550v4 [Populus trichocarpa]
MDIIRHRYNNVLTYCFLGSCNGDGSQVVKKKKRRLTTGTRSASAISSIILSSIQTLSLCSTGKRENFGRSGVNQITNIDGRRKTILAFFSDCFPWVCVDRGTNWMGMGLA